MSRTLKRHAARPLGFERLHSRLCLAVDAVLDDDGLLTITGTPEDDSIVIRDNRQGEIVVETRDPDDRFEPFAGVERIVVNSLAGDDTIRYHVRRGGSIPAEFNLGDGEDELSASVGFGRDDVADRSADLEVDAGGGDDEVHVALLVPAVQKVRDAAARTSLNFTADLGAGNDELRVRGHGAAETILDVTGGEGDDDVRIGLLLPAVHKLSETDTSASIVVDLGAGNDGFSLGALGVKEVDVDVTAGEGDDEVDIGLLLPARLTVEGSMANIVVDLGPGADKLEVKARGYETVETDITGDEDEGDDVEIDTELDRRPNPRPVVPPGRGRGGR